MAEGFSSAMKCAVPGTRTAVTFSATFCIIWPISGPSVLISPPNASTGIVSLPDSWMAFALQEGGCLATGLRMSSAAGHTSLAFARQRGWMTSGGRRPQPLKRVHVGVGEFDVTGSHILLEMHDR